MNNTPIAIVGYAYRAPGVGRKGLWEFLAEAKSAWSRVPSDRFDQDAYYNHGTSKAGLFSSAGAHFLPDDIYGFDAPFFHLRPDEAHATDPQHRMMLECALEAVENAGLSLTDILKANIGVFAAVGSLDYGQQVTEDLLSTTTWSALGNAACMFANRLSYFFDLTGPSISLDAACASSSYAVHLACQSLRSGECNAAFVGASSLILGPGQWACLDNMGALSPEGKSFSYDAKASGFGRGEGAACLIVKRLDDALKNGDPIHAVIRNSACSHSGRSEGGITMPSRRVQEQLLLRVHEEVGLKPSETPVVEGHGTGTQVGDPIEASAFASILGSERTTSNPLYIGSLKSNFGHLESASGLLGIIKAILMIQHASILPNAGFETFNKRIEGIDKLKVASTTTPWPSNAPKRVCVTNFGFGGSNAAIILEETPSQPQHFDALVNGTGLTNGTKHISKIEQINGINHEIASESIDGVKPENSITVVNGNNAATAEQLNRNAVQRLFVLSAKSESSLALYRSSFIKYLETSLQSDEFQRHLSYTLGQRRTHHPYRLAVTAHSVDNLKTQILASKISKIKDVAIAFAFTGQGAQHAQMAIRLQRYKPFATAIAQAEAHLQAIGASWSLREELDKPDDESRINDAEISQPACTAIQLALVELFKAWGITPTTVTGHSSGEIAAAFAANLISFRAAIAISYFRGQAVAQLAKDKPGQKGAMLALGASFQVASDLLLENTHGYATIAAINSPQSVTISGDNSAIESIHKVADQRGLFARRLKVEVAYHSKHMAQVATAYSNSITPFCNSDTPSVNQTDSHAIFVSSVTGNVVGANTVDAAYWVKNLLQPVRFAEAIECVLAPHDDKTDAGVSKLTNVIVEIGPHSALKNPINQTLGALHVRSAKAQAQNLTYLPSLIRGVDDDEALLGLAGKLFTLGWPVCMAAVNQADHRNAHVLSDVPPYEWEKTTRYFHKSRITKEKLHPNHSYDPLLGRKSPYDEAGEHSFMQSFTIDDIPWLRDHNVGGNTVFPMTGYLSLAIEALRRISPTTPSSMLVREFHVKQSLDIDGEERVSIATKLRPAATGTENFSSTAWAFDVSSWSESQGWTTHCHGLIEAEATEMSMETPTLKASVSLLGIEGLRERSAEAEYHSQAQEGTLYGPTFRTMRKFWEGTGYTVLETELRDINLSLPYPYGSPVSVDPPTLDTCLQGIGPFQEIDGRRSAHMPNYVSRLRISNSIPAVEKQRFTIVTRLLDRDSKAGSMRFSMAAFAQCPGFLVPVVEWESVTVRSISSSVAEDLASTLPASYRWDLVPSFDFASQNDLVRMAEIDHVEEHEHARVSRRQLSAAAVYYMNRALNETAGDDLSKLPSHLSSYLNWSRRFDSRGKVSFDDQSLSLLAEISKSNAHGEMICAVGEQLAPILRGEVQPLEVMLKDGLLTRYYEHEVGTARLNAGLAKLVRRLSNVKSDLRVLEVGGGTCSATLPVLQELSHGAEELPEFISYTFTDISPGFFENARTKLGKLSQHITFKKLDISQDPAKQGFPLEHYDVVIASNVLHATPNMAVTLDHVRTLLKPNGKLLVLETVHNSPLIMPFALLPDWWVSEDEYRSRQGGAIMSEETWQSILTARGFSGVDVAIGDFPDSEHVISLICSTRRGLKEDGLGTATITICGQFMDDEEQEFAHTISDHLIDRLGSSSTIKPFSEIDPADDSFCIFVDSTRQSILQDLSESSFETLKSTLLGITGLLWVIPETHHPDASMIKGVLRTLRLETESKNLLLLENIPYTSQGALAITELAERLQDPETVTAIDQDFFWHKGVIQLPRFRQLTAARDVFAYDAAVPVRKVQNIWQDDTSFEMTIKAAGSPDSIYFRRTDDLTQGVGESEVLIRNEAAGMNFRDLLLVLGSIPWQTPGFEGVGTVVQTGSRVHDLQPGDRVFYGALEGGSFATYKRISSWRACKVPDGISSVDAATIPVAYTTAVVALMRIGRLQKGESVLIHAASGAVGQACIVLAQYLGAQIFATAGTPAKRDFLQKTFKIPKENIFSSRTPNFRDSILHATNNKGIDVIINSLSGNLLQETWSLISEFGRFIEIGKRDLLENSYLTMRPFDRNATFSAVDLRKFFDHKPDEMRDCLLEVVQLLKRKIIVPIRPATVLPISQLVTGLRRLQSGQNIGKIVITMGPDDCVLADCPPPLGHLSDRLLRPDATYLITGGTGGIGLALASWLVEKGATSIVLLGRSGSTRPEVLKLLERYRGSDIQVRAVACDVGSRLELVNALKSISDLPPVRGIVHGALHLRDSLFENASYEDWQSITRPRVQGAWNLHELVPDVDFFIALSSFVGAVGNNGQSIYAGTATFFDDFARYRNAQGLQTVSISLPVVLDVGYAADRDLTEGLKETLGATLSEAQIQTLVKGAILGPSSGLNYDGKVISFTLASGEDPSTLAWQCFHPMAIVEHINAKQQSPESDSTGLGHDRRSVGLRAAINGSNPLPGVIDALITKVSSMTMIERDEVEPDAPLSKYSLDSLVSVELRDWVRRETGVKLSLARIQGAGNLGALATNILSRKEPKN